MIIRQAKQIDANDMVDLINDIIARGGTTAHQTPFDVEKMRDHYIARAESICCQVAENDAGKVIGFQSLVWAKNPDDLMPKGWAIIATFVATAAAGQGVGQGLFQATKNTAAANDVRVIDATIRSDNTFGLRYYTGLGFVDYAELTDTTLSDGTYVSRIRKRFDL